MCKCSLEIAVQLYICPGLGRGGLSLFPIALYRGFERKGGGIRIITFRVTTRLLSKSNRCI
jgi:hypothetical protein